jgi:hypothetical protein
MDGSPSAKPSAKPRTFTAWRSIDLFPFPRRHRMLDVSVV